MQLRFCSPSQRMNAAMNSRCFCSICSCDFSPRKLLHVHRHDEGKLDVAIQVLPKRSSNAVALTIDFECSGISVPSSLDEKDLQTGSRRRFSSDKQKFRVRTATSGWLINPLEPVQEAVFQFVLSRPRLEWLDGGFHQRDLF